MRSGVHWVLVVGGRPLNSHGATARLMVSAVISRSHGGGLISHGLSGSTVREHDRLT